MTTVAGPRPSTVKLFVRLMVVNAVLNALGMFWRNGPGAVVGVALLGLIQLFVLRALWNGRAWSRTLLTVLALLSLGFSTLALLPTVALGWWSLVLPLAFGCVFAVVRLALLWSYKTTEFIERQSR